MSHRIAIAVLTALMSSLMLLSAPAHAAVPKTATVEMSKADAKLAAKLGQQFFAHTLPGPRSYRVTACHDGPRLWVCDVTAIGNDTRCTADLWVWRDESDFYLEWHRLRCGPK